MEDILAFSRTIQYPGILGNSLVLAVSGDNESDKMLDALLAHASDMPVLVRGYAIGCIEKNGPEWVGKEVERLRVNGTYSPEGCALLYLGLPENANTWMAVETHGAAEGAAYWKYASGYSQTDMKGEAPFAVERLLNAKRPKSALELAGAPDADIPSELLQRLLQQFLEDDKRTTDRVKNEFYLGHVFDQLYRKAELSLEEIAMLEFPDAALFDDLKRYTSAPMALHRVLQTNPLFFADLVSLIYKRDDHAYESRNGKEIDEVRRDRARVARDVMDSWYLLPGAKEQGMIDEKELADWIESARKRGVEMKCLTGADIQIGFILARAATDPDGVWPHVAVRNVIERFKNTTIDEHIQTGLYNSRGVTTRGMTDGGAQERALAQKYRTMADTVNAQWPRTGAILRAMANRYQCDARSEDVNSDLNDLRWD